MLAFKSDVSHWRQKKEMVGVSVRYVLSVLRFSFPVLISHTQNGMLYVTERRYPNQP